MAFIGGAVVRVSPSYVMPDTVVQFSQPSGAFELLFTGEPLVRLGEGDLFVYMTKLEARTRVAAGQTAYNELPSCTLVASQIQTPTYLMRNRAEYDHHDIASAARWGVPLPEAQRLAMRQGHFMQERNALLYGFQPQNGEGLLNTQGATAINLPPDPENTNNTTVVTYTPYSMAIFLLGQIQQAKSRAFQLGQPSRVVICGPQRVLGQFSYTNIVGLSSFQLPGGGTATTLTVAERILQDNGDDLEWVYDDTLQGKGAGGTDAILIVIPEVKRPNRGNPSTNELAQLMPGFLGTTLQLTDMAAPREIPTPLPGGAIDVLSEMRITSGWGVRPETIVIVSMQYQ